MRIIFSPQAQRDIRAIGDWIARDDRTTAVIFVARLVDACTAIADLPEGYPEVIVDGRPLRRKNYGRYRILYDVRRGRIRIVSIMHGARSH